MPAITNLILTDRATTPVNHTFVPEGIPNGVATLVESDGVKVGDKKFTIAKRKNANRRKVHLRMVVPVVATETINGISEPKVVRTAYANIDFNFDVRSTRQERDDLVGMLYTALADGAAMVDKAVVDLEDVY